MELERASGQSRGRTTAQEVVNCVGGALEVMGYAVKLTGTSRLSRKASINKQNHHGVIEQSLELLDGSFPRKVYQLIDRQNHSRPRILHCSIHGFNGAFACVHQEMQEAAEELKYIVYVMVWGDVPEPQPTTTTCTTRPGSAYWAATVLPSVRADTS